MDRRKKIDGAYGSRSYGGNRSNRDDMVTDDRFLDTLDRRGDGYRYYSSSCLDRHYDRHHNHPYKRSDKGYFLDEFKKVKPPNFDGYLKKSEDVEPWLTEMKKFFELHEYTKNMKAKIVIFRLKGKAYIWW